MLRYIFLVGHDRSQEVVGYNLQPKNHDLWIFMASLGCTLPMLLVSHCLMIMDVWRLSGRVAFVVSIDFGLLFPIYSIFPMIEKNDCSIPPIVSLLFIRILCVIRAWYIPYMNPYDLLAICGAGADISASLAGLRASLLPPFARIRGLTVDTTRTCT